jgi:hypothetical protein
MEQRLDGQAGASRRLPFVFALESVLDKNLAWQKKSLALGLKRV